MVVVADEQHTVTGRYAEQRDETDNCRNTHFSGRDDESKDTADQRQRQVQQNHTRFFDTAEFVVEQQEDNDDAHKRGQRQGAAGCLFAFKLAAIFDVVAFGQLNGGINLLLNIVDNTAEVTVGYIRGDDDFPFYVFAVDRVRSHRGNDFRYVVQRNFASVVGNQPHKIFS